MITWDEIIEVEAKLYDEKTKTVITNFSEKNATRKIKNLYVLLSLLLITLLLLVAIIYCCLIKYRVKQKTFITISSHR